MILKDYGKEPTKPCLDGEPRYEDHPVGLAQGRQDGDGLMNFDVRQASLLECVCGAAAGNIRLS